MRGKADNLNYLSTYARITPAYAGKSLHCCFFDNGIGDHPRLCGEKLNSGNKCKFQSGSPPPMRGKVLLDVLLASTHRITPAYAGKSYWLVFNCCAFEDHPRLCGEKL